MTISIKHAKNNNIADWTQSQLDAIIAGKPAPLPRAGTVLNDVTLPSDWNDEHTVTGVVESVVAGTGISVDDTDPANPIVSAPGGTNYWTASGDDIYNNNTGNVGIGTTAPIKKLHVSYAFISDPQSFSATLTHEAFPNALTDTFSIIYQPYSPSSGNASYDDGIGGTYQAEGQTFTITIWGYTGSYSSPGSGDQFIFSDSRNDGTFFGLDYTWSPTTNSDGSPMDGYVVQVNDSFTGITTSYFVSGGSTSSFQDANTGGSFGINPFPMNFTANGTAWGISPYEVVVFDSTSYYNATTPVSVTDNGNGTYIIFNHIIGGTSGGAWRLIDRSGNGMDGTGDTSFNQLAPFSGDNTVTPNHYGIIANGSNWNRDYQSYGTDNALDTFSSSFLTASVTDPNDGQYYYTQFEFGDPFVQKLLRQDNGGGYLLGQNYTTNGSSGVDVADTAWADGTNVLPQNAPEDTALFENGNTAFGGAAKSQLILNATGAFAVPDLQFQSNSGNIGRITYNASSGNPALIGGSNNWDVYDAGVGVSARIGRDNHFNVAQSSLVNFQVSGVTKINMITATSSTDSLEINPALLGYFGATPVAQQSGDIAVGLVNLGLFSSATPPLSSPARLKTTAGINAKIIANTNLYTPPTGKTAIITGYIVRCSAATAITIGCTAGIGNVSGTNNIAPSQAMTTLTSTDDLFEWAIVGMSVTVTTGNSAFFNLATAATGTSQTLIVDLIGYLV